WAFLRVATMAFLYPTIQSTIANFPSPRNITKTIQHALQYSVSISPNAIEPTTNPLSRMASDFFYPQPGGVESHIYQLSSVCHHWLHLRQLVPLGVEPP